jgi:hypothetical protein
MNSSIEMAFCDSIRHGLSDRIRAAYRALDLSPDFGRFLIVLAPPMCTKAIQLLADTCIFKELPDLPKNASGAPWK